MLLCWKGGEWMQTCSSRQNGLVCCVTWQLLCNYHSCADCWGSSFRLVYNCSALNVWCLPLCGHICEYCLEPPAELSAEHPFFIFCSLHASPLFLPSLPLFLLSFQSYVKPFSLSGCFIEEALLLREAWNFRASCLQRCKAQLACAGRMKWGFWLCGLMGISDLIISFLPCFQSFWCISGHF